MAAWRRKLRRYIAGLYADAIKGCDYLQAQKIPADCKSAWWTFTVRYLREDVTWQQFRKKYMEYGGDGIYAAWKLLYEETVFTSNVWRRHCPPLYDNYTFERCPNAEVVQPQIMQFVANYESLDAARPKVDALAKTIRHFA